LPFEFYKTALVTLLVTLDPPGLAPLFIGLTVGMSAAEKREVALRGSLIAFAVLALFAFAGRFVMDALGVSMPAFRVAGGLLLFYIAFDMVFALRGERKQDLANNAVGLDRARDVAAFPLAIPLMAGPGSITATMLLAGRASGDPLLLAGLMTIVALAMATTYLTLRLADRVSHWLGSTGKSVLTRMLGVILAALAVQFVIDGVKSAAL
jgi:multiple antibiotic resistance protein